MYQPYVVLPDDLPYDRRLANELSNKCIQYQELPIGVIRRQYLNPHGVTRLFYNTAKSSQSLIKQVKSERISLIHSNTTAVISGGFVARRCSVKHIWHVREIITSPYWFKMFIANMLLALADVVIAVSGSVRDNLLTAQPRLDKKIIVINNGIEYEPFLCNSLERATSLRAKWGFGDQDIVIGMIGRISSWKGQLYLLDAINSIVSRIPRLRVMLVGGCVPGEEWRKDDLIRHIDLYGLKDIVRVDEFRLDVPSVLSAFDIFVLPSTRPDPFPTVVLEAMASALPVIATAHGGALEQVEHGVSGMLVSPIDPAEMSRAILTMAADRSLRQAMGYAGRERVQRHFALKRYLDDIMALYERTLQ
jgi:glycosyltransferase involved in cell wall biosynthesis